MKNLMSKVDVAYLPDHSSDPFDFLDAVDLNELNYGYQFCITHGARSYCTYPSLINCIESPNYITRLCAVIDFPTGKSTAEEKIFQAGRAFEMCRKSSSSEIDVVLHSSVIGAKEDVDLFRYAQVHKSIGVKFIIELGNRTWTDTKEVVKHLNSRPNAIKFIKTNTGKSEAITFNKKLQLVGEIRELTNIPIKVSGGVSNWQEMQDYINIAGEDTIFGVSYSKIKEWV